MQRTTPALACKLAASHAAVEPARRRRLRPRPDSRGRARHGSSCHPPGSSGPHRTLPTPLPGRLDADIRRRLPPGGPPPRPSSCIRRTEGGSELHANSSFLAPRRVRAAALCHRPDLQPCRRHGRPRPDTGGRVVGPGRKIASRHPDPAVERADRLSPGETDRGRRRDVSLLNNVPPNPYHLSAAAPGFAPVHLDVDVRSSVPLVRDVTFKVAVTASEKVKRGRRAVALETDTAARPRGHRQVTHRALSTAAVASRAFESIILSAPGLQPGRERPLSLPGRSLAATVGGSMGSRSGTRSASPSRTRSGPGDRRSHGDRRRVESLPEYGEKANGVINMTTRSALGHQGWHGFRRGLGLGRVFDFRAIRQRRLGDISPGGLVRGAWTARDSDRFLDPVSFDNFHNHGETRRGFLRYDAISAAGSDSIRLTGRARDSRTATSPTCHRRRRAASNSASSRTTGTCNIGYQHLSSADTVFNAQTYGRDNRQKLDPLGRGYSGDRRSEALAGEFGRASVWGDGGSPGSTKSRSGRSSSDSRSTRTSTSASPTPDSTIPNRRATTRTWHRTISTRGGAPFEFSDTETGTYGALFAQDTIRLHALTVNAGLRYDHNHLFETESQLPTPGRRWRI